MEQSKVIKRLDWERADLCAECGVYLSENALYTHWDSLCPNCGAIDNLGCPHVTTSRRFCVTYEPNLFARVFKRRDTEGFYEWSGKSTDGSQLGAVYFGKHKRILASNSTLIAATGIASGLF